LDDEVGGGRGATADEKAVSSPSFDIVLAALIKRTLSDRSSGALFSDSNKNGQCWTLTIENKNRNGFEELGVTKARV
jgi:hypothetical protein